MCIAAAGNVLVLRVGCRSKSRIREKSGLTVPNLKVSNTKLLQLDKLGLN
jgi:hypothetical protein